MIGVFAYGLIYGLTTEEEIAKHQGEDYLQEVLKRKLKYLEGVLYKHQPLVIS